MSARTRKTAAELGLRPEYLAALEQVLDGLRAGRLVHMVGNDPPAGATELFNMAHWQDTVWDDSVAPTRECGTVACIGGWAQKFSSMGPFSGLADGVDHDGPQHNGLNWLFYPDEGPDGQGSFNFDYAKITPSQAATALENYLATGSPRWDEVLGS